jgi:hypothetical protein
MSLGGRFKARQETLHTIEKEELARYFPCYIVFPFAASRSVGTLRECPTRQQVISTVHADLALALSATNNTDEVHPGRSSQSNKVECRMMKTKTKNKKREREHGRNCIHRSHSHAQPKWSHWCVLGPLPLDAARSRACSPDSGISSWTKHPHFQPAPKAQLTPGIQLKWCIVFAQV